MLRVKTGVLPRNLVIAAAAANVAQELGVTATITSGIDGKHMKGSKHYDGDALDFRLLLPRYQRRFIAQLSVHLGVNYQLIMEVDHLHVEYDPQTTT